MDKSKQERLEAHAWKVGSAAELVGLSDEEAHYTELRLRLSQAVQTLRKRQQRTQKQLAEQLRSSQSRVAKAEAGDASVSLDLLIRTLFALGASDLDLAEIIAGPRARSVVG